MEATDETRRDDSDLPEHRVAIVLFTTVRAVDDQDAAFVARRAIVTLLTPSGVVRPHQPAMITARLRDSEVHVQVSEVMELGVAGGNGAVWIKPTNRAYPREENR